MKLAMEKRLKFIDSRLFWEGCIRRKNLEDFFRTSTPQATKDIKMYTNLAPNNINYDTKAKQYVATKDFTPHFGEPTSEDYLTRLLHLKRKGPSSEFFCGTIIDYEEMPRIRRYVDREILKSIVLAIKDKRAIRISYQSMSSDLPQKRWISPHSLAHDGNRWHIRAFCYKKNIYCDFNIGRVLKIYDMCESDFGKSLDYAWNTDIRLLITAHPKLKGGKKSCIELDYDMIDGRREFSIKAAFYFYAQKLFGFDVKNQTLKGEQQQIVLENYEEVNLKLEIIQEMNAKAIAQTISEGAQII
ncbi:WYL domain-containing protein [Desulforhopalus sp. 52FAK]